MSGAFDEDGSEGAAIASTNGGIESYLEEINIYEREASSWEKKARKILARYKNERAIGDEKRRFNILWSNVQTLLPALYGRDPKASVTRRFQDGGDTARLAGQALEKCCDFFIGDSEFGDVVRDAVRDDAIVGRGVMWMRYVPHMRDVSPCDGVEITDTVNNDEDAEPEQEVYFEEVIPDHVTFDDFGHNICKKWSEVYLVWRCVYLDKTELKERFPDKWKDVPMDYKQKKLNDSGIAGSRSMATIYELWDKRAKVAVWLHKDLPEALDRRDDPLKLSNFFPCPMPLFSNLAGDSLIPTPDYVQYQDQAIQLDELTARIASVTKSLKVAGVYDSSAPALDRLLSEGVDNKLIPVDQWAVFGEKGGLKGAVDFMPLESIVASLKGMYEARDKVKQDLYEVTGMSDIIRGASNPDETATAQRIKGAFASHRLDDRQRKVQRFARDAVRIMGEVIANQFSITCIKTISGMQLFLNEQNKAIAQQNKAASQAQAGQTQANPNLAQMNVANNGGSKDLAQMNVASPHLGQVGHHSGQVAQTPAQMGYHLGQVPEEMDEDHIDDALESPTWEEVEKLLRDEPARRFRLGIETNSTIKMDEETEKVSRNEFLQAFSGYLKQAMEAGQQNPDMVPMLARMLMFVVRAYPIGKDLEECIEAFVSKMEKAAANPQPKPPSPEQQKAQADMQMHQAETQAKIQIEQAKAQAQSQADQARAQADIQVQQHKMQQDMEMERMRIQADMQLEQFKQNAQERQIEQQNAVETSADKMTAMLKAHFEQTAQNAEAQTRIMIEHIKGAVAIEVARVQAKNQTDDGKEPYAFERSKEA